MYTRTCQGVPLWNPLGKGCQNGAPFFPRCFLTCFGPSGIYISSLLSEATEAMTLSCFFCIQKKYNGACQMCHLRVRGDAQRVSFWHPFTLRGIVLAPLSACRQAVTTTESRIICVSEFPKIKDFVVQLASNHLSQKWCYHVLSTIIITISCCDFLVRLRGVET